MSRKAIATRRGSSSKTGQTSPLSTASATDNAASQAPNDASDSARRRGGFQQQEPANRSLTAVIVIKPQYVAAFNADHIVFCVSFVAGKKA
jgi:hypothetical protein